MTWQEIATIILANMLHVAIWAVPAAVGGWILGNIDSLAEWLLTGGLE